MENHEYIWIPQTTEIHLGESLAYTYVHKFLLCFSFVVWKFKSIYRKDIQVLHEGLNINQTVFFLYPLVYAYFKAESKERT